MTEDKSTQPDQASTSRPIVILHGWSGDYTSFQPLAKLLQAKLRTPDVSVIHLADYVSMEDELRFDDIVAAMEAAWKDKGLPIAARSVDAIVHSTGGLVIRDWLQRYHGPHSAPINHLVMLAPANFGSPLAHKGRSLIARIWKGFLSKRQKGKAFHTGTQILKGLELASPYTWNLAERDRFGEGANMYAPDGVLCTVFVGQNAGDPRSAIADEDGWDGVVRVSTANMNCARLTIDLGAYQDGGPSIEHDVEVTPGGTAFSILDSHDHQSITLSHTKEKSLAQVEGSKRDGPLFEDIVRALKVDDDQFPNWQTELEERNREIQNKYSTTRSPEKHGYQNTVVRVEDQFGVGVQDFLVELFERDNDNTKFSRKRHRDALRKVHAYCDDSSYRSLYVDCTALYRNIDKTGEFLGISITAHPEMDQDALVGFRAYGKDGQNGIRIAHDQLAGYFEPNRTMLITLKLARQQSKDVFRLIPQ